MVDPKTLPAIPLSLLAIAILIMPATAAGTVSVDRDPVGLEESFQVVFQADS
jgi:hypothetical protein